MTREPELTGSGLRLPTADGRGATIALAAGPGEVFLVIADPSATNASTGEPAPIATDYPFTLTAARHLRERLALVIAEAEQLAAGVEAEPVEPRVSRPEPELPAVISAHA